MGLFLIYISCITIPILIFLILFILSSFLPQFLKNYAVRALEYIYDLTLPLKIGKNNWSPSILFIYFTISFIVELYSLHQLFKNPSPSFGSIGDPSNKISILRKERNFWISSFTFFMILILHSIKSNVQQLQYIQNINELIKTDLENSHIELISLTNLLKETIENNNLLQDKLDELQNKEPSPSLPLEKNKEAMKENNLQGKQQNTFESLNQKSKSNPQTSTSTTSSSLPSSPPLPSAPSTDEIISTVEASEPTAPLSPSFATPGLEMMGLRHRSVSNS